MARRIALHFQLFPKCEVDAFLEELALSDEDPRPVNPRLGFGNVGKVLQKEIDRRGPDLVVSATHGMGEFRQATIGSTASRLQREPIGMPVPSK